MERIPRPVRFAPVIPLICATWCGAQPLPQAVTFAWDTPTNTVDISHLTLAWPGGALPLGVFETSWTVDNFPPGIAQPVGIHSTGTNGQTSVTNTITIASGEAVFECAGELEGQWSAAQVVPFTFELPPGARFVRLRLVAGNERAGE